MRVLDPPNLSQNACSGGAGNAGGPRQSVFASAIGRLAGECRARATEGRSRRTKRHSHQRGPHKVRASLCSSPIDPPEQNLPPTCHLPPPPRCHAPSPDRRRRCAICGSPPARPAMRTARYVHYASSDRPAPPSDHVGRRTGHAPHRRSNTQIHPRGTFCRRGARPLARDLGPAGAMARRRGRDGPRTTVGSHVSRG